MTTPSYPAAESGGARLCAKHGDAELFMASLAELVGRRRLKVGYFVHNLNDPAVARRTSMLTAGGAEVVLLGFQRGGGRTTVVAGAPARQVGRTHDARFMDRIKAVILAALAAPVWLADVRDADVLIARNLEMLALARVAQGLCGARPILAYEVLDVHRLLLSSGPAGHFLRWMERRLARPVRRIIASSPAFITNYFQPYRQLDAPVVLVENKVLAEPHAASAPLQRPAAPPWRIGWFGMLRCRRSLEILTRLCEHLPGRIEVDIRGRVAETEIADIVGATASCPGMRFWGPYNATELPAAYAAVHFVWAIDFFEAGANSDWLLPNRLYEGQLYGAVPLAQAQVETGRWLSRHGAGVRFRDLETELPEFFATLTEAGYQTLAMEIQAVPRSALACGQEDCRAFVDALRPESNEARSYELPQSP